MISDTIPEDTWKAGDGQTEQQTEAAKQDVNFLRKGLVMTSEDWKMEVQSCVRNES